ncbi:PUA-like domain-containing protein [Desarmillaria tabescens]|uniref:PUA-like domain-containing protein n=1 Tax=Armillaria tabescens TaxID=1929756 RepID=A0AA39NFM2_ARMTA|nr:PUA-like domain-containing protein [Desarmillaria tabescens]KAK0464751.1 PUA-like domain-containing protein [Desarmillaria tabescens]
MPPFPAGPLPIPARNSRVHGHIAGVPVGSIFPGRLQVRAAGLHNPPRSGIFGTSKEGGAYSVVVSGGYEDDEDHGTYFTYTGSGGRTEGYNTVQVADQEWKRGNRTLKMSATTGNPVRVIRGQNNSRYAPSEGYRYDGLYKVIKAWRQRGQTGFKTCRFLFVLLEGNAHLGKPPDPDEILSLLRFDEDLDDDGGDVAASDSEGDNSSTRRSTSVLSTSSSKSRPKFKRRRSSSTPKPIVSSSRVAPPRPVSPLIRVKFEGTPREPIMADIKPAKRVKLEQSEVAPIACPPLVDANVPATPVKERIRTERELFDRIKGKQSISRR